VSNQGVFTRLLYYATVHLRFNCTEFWLTPIGEILDLWECHKIHMGWAEPRREFSIDDVIWVDVL
jgi:hypothetical protein